MTRVRNIYNACVEKQKPGPKIQRPFEQMLWGELLCTFLLPQSNENSESTDAISFQSCIYSRDIIKVVAGKLQQEPIWRNDEKVKELKFSDGWVTKLLPC